MIPHVAHFFWANRTMSWLRYMTLHSFRYHNPDVPMKLHRYMMPSVDRVPWDTPERQEFANLEQSARDYFPDVVRLDVEMLDWTPPCHVFSPTHASDIFQWYILSTEGGVYCDLDILFVKPVFPQIQDHRDAYVCFWLDAVPIGFLASCPENPFFRDVYETSIRNQRTCYQSSGCESVVATVEAYDTFRSTRILSGNNYERIRFGAVQERYRSMQFVNLQREIVYPFWCDDTGQIFKARRPDQVRDQTIGIHWYAGSPLSQEFNRQMNHENFRQFPNTYSHFAGMLQNV